MIPKGVLMKPYLLNPFWQAAVTVAVMILALVAFRLANAKVWGWNAAALALLLFCTVNAVAGIFVPGIWIYLLKSVLLFIGLVFLAFFLSPLITGLSYNDYGDNAMIFVAPFLYYPVLLVIMGVVRAVR